MKYISSNENHVILLVSPIYKVQTAGRINVIGEHTDHQLGYVLPMSINAKITLFGSMRSDNQISAFTENYNQKFYISINEINSYIPQKGNWFNFIVGIAKWFNNKFPISKGLDILILSDLPEGAGLSSSAALEVGLLTLFEKIYNYEFERFEAISMCWEVENKFIGLKCGIMDQFIVKVGLKNQLHKLDCATLQNARIDLPENVIFLIIDTKIKHKLINTPYNKRIEECQEGLRQLKILGFKKDYLSIIPLDAYLNIMDKVEKPYSSRIKHVLSENERVKKFFEWVRFADPTKKDELLFDLGRLLYDSHDSLKNDFECSWERADQIVNYCKTESQRGIYGARMVGGGWGGSVLIMVNKNSCEAIMRQLETWFLNTFHDRAIIYQFAGSNGTESNEISLEELPINYRTYFM